MSACVALVCVCAFVKRKKLFVLVPNDVDHKSCIKITVIQALVYGILPPTTAMIDYAIGFGNLSANGQPNIILGISFRTTRVAYASTNETKII